jgi:hypothetical protein
MASPKKKWLRAKAVEDAAKAEAEAAENARQVSEAEVAKQVTEAEVAKQVTEAKVAATKVSIEKTTSTRRPSRRRTNRN